jgi:hypothetical protein
MRVQGIEFVEREATSRSDCPPSSRWKGRG